MMRGPWVGRRSTQMAASAISVNPMRIKIPWRIVETRCAVQNCELWFANLCDFTKRPLHPTELHERQVLVLALGMCWKAAQPCIVCPLALPIGPRHQAHNRRVDLKTIQDDLRFQLA